MKKGEIIKSGNFKLDKQIGNLNEFWIVINTSTSIYARHRMYPTSFFYSWNIKLIKRWLDAGWFWTADKLNESK